MKYILKHKFLIIFLALLILTTFFFLYPRNVWSLMSDNTPENVEVIKTDDQAKHTLNNKQIKEIKELFSRSYVRRKIKIQKFTNRYSMCYVLALSNNDKLIYFFTDDIISIDGVQYALYGNGAADKFKEIIEGQVE